MINPLLNLDSRGLVFRSWCDGFQKLIAEQMQKIGRKTTRQVLFLKIVNRKRLNVFSATEKPHLSEEIAFDNFTDKMKS